MGSPSRFKALLRAGSRLALVAAALVAAASAPRAARAQREAPQCSIDAAAAPGGVDDPDLHEMAYDVGDGPMVTKVYVEPDVSTFYFPPDGKKRTKVKPKFNGLSGKFINMSNKPVSLYW
jgi:hypothetical protein